MTSTDAFEIIKQVFDERTAYICSLGRTAELGYRYFPSQTLFLDCMGSVTPTAIGVALGSKSITTVALDTDGSILMGISVLSVLSSLVSELKNLKIIVFDNKMLESAGGLVSRSCDLNWALLGAAWEITISEIDNTSDFSKIISPDGFQFIVLKIKNNTPSVCSKDVDGIESKYIFSRHLEKVLLRKILIPSIKN